LQTGLSFPKDCRLLRRPDFLAVKASGQGFAEGPLAASFRPAEHQTRVGLTVSTKVGPAVVRNRVKRRLREAVRHELTTLPAVDLVLVARSSAKNASVAVLRAWLRRAAARMRLAK
jgi:ribonuclease P protein component